MQVTPSLPATIPTYWPSARQFTEAVQCPAVCFSDPDLKTRLPAIDRLGMPLVTSGQFAYVYKLNSQNGGPNVAVRCFRGYLGDRDQRYRAIQQYLNEHPVAFLSDFRYATEGILVNGHRYPILFMDWIEGPTLDLYIEEMVHRKEVLLHLSREWLKLIAGLRGAGIAHGDLQHGNIIVEHGRLRLVDHDGIFVPTMLHSSSSEVGHQHYQHPSRDPDFFDSTLDNFSAIVIYLTLISLAEQPDLWSQYHDENLLFTKSDFIDPGSSSLFAKIRSIGTEHHRIAETLAAAASDRPETVPSLLDLVGNRISGLPTWMSSPVGLESQTKTREATLPPALDREQPRWIPWRARSQRVSMPTTPPSGTVQTLFGGSATPAMVGSLAKVSDPNDILRNTPIFAKEMLSKTFLWWYWSGYVLLQIIGLDFFPSLGIAIILMGIACLTYGFIRAQQVSREARLANIGSPPQVATLNTPMSKPRPALPISITGSGPIVGNAALNIYHLADCAWVNQIISKNRVGFSSSIEALRAGYKPCQVCSPKS